MRNQEGYTRKIENLIKEFSEEIGKLKSRAGEASSETTADYKRIITDLEAQQRKVENRLEDFKNADPDSQEGFTIAFEQFREDIRKSIEHAKSVIR